MSQYLVIARTTVDHLPLFISDNLKDAQEYADTVNDGVIIESASRAVVLGHVFPARPRWVGVVEFVAGLPIRIVSKREI